MQNGNNMDKEPITLNGLNKLKEELIFLKEKKRPEIVAAIAEARSHGDLKENAEYHAAKEEQSHNEGRITEINDIIARANVIDVTKINNDGKVIFGATVFLENLDTGEKIDYKIVGKDEADLKEDAPAPLLTEREIEGLNNGYTIPDLKANPDLFANLDDTNRRFLSKEEYIDVYVNRMKLTAEQRAQLLPYRGGARASWSHNDNFDFLTSSQGIINKTETTASKYWEYIPSLDQQRFGISTAQSRAYNERNYGPDALGTGSWRFNEQAARDDAAEAYDGEDDTNEDGTYKTGDEGMLGSMNAVMVDPDSGGDYGLPGFNVDAYMLNQPYEGTGQALHRTYSTTYDHYAKSQDALNQLNSIWQATSNLSLIHI